MFGQASTDLERLKKLPGVLLCNPECHGVRADKGGGQLCQELLEEGNVRRISAGLILWHVACAQPDVIGSRLLCLSLHWVGLALVRPPHCVLRCWHLSCAELEHMLTKQLPDAGHEARLDSADKKPLTQATGLCQSGAEGVMYLPCKRMPEIGLQMTT